MDNFIQYVFYLIIIIAFLNSIFGKKKKVETKQVPQEPAPQPNKRDYTEERAKEFEKQLNKREYSSDWFNKSIKNKLQVPESLKDYIIISEILGKPKAFE